MNLEELLINQENQINWCSFCKRIYLPYDNSCGICKTCNPSIMEFHKGGSMNNKLNMDFFQEQENLISNLELDEDLDFFFDDTFSL